MLCKIKTTKKISKEKKIVRKLEREDYYTKVCYKPDSNLLR
ncbi:hypothetical protein HMPREF0631_0257 [Peptostreptococcus anaerobius 653-L]|uniref:Uncharacterized protein n=1 Tax=Peptostreptococcus anaerobius 653-L TaxID=596329 RepID=D3MSE8_9FIRM|nr:hypothetical protein HMPREF0631_0257 [Peptostreptococcus anaerobius 653-L]